MSNEEIARDPQVRQAAQLAMNDALQNKQQFEMAGQQTYVGHIDFPEVEHYGWDHHEQMSWLVKNVFVTLPLATEGPSWEQRKHLEVCRLAGLMHDLGRQAPWPQPDPGHAQRSAQIAERLLKEDPQFAPDPALREHLIVEVPRIIANHNLEGPQPNDPRAQALWDADSYDILRFNVGDVAHFRNHVKSRLARLCTPWAKNPENIRRWRVFRGWSA